jgi:Cu-Zn family superoxide dismutase
MRALRSRISASASTVGMSARSAAAVRDAMATTTTRATATATATRRVTARATTRRGTARTTTRRARATRDDATRADVDNATGTRAGRRADAARALASAMVALHASASVAWAGEATYAARLTPTRAGAGASGEVEFSLETNRANQEVVVVRANVRGLTPGKHGINVHENGDVSGCDDAGACTGKSYNPDKRPHHGPTALKKFGASACHFVGDGCVLNRHIGDLGNIVADENGDSTTSFKDLYTTLKAGTSNSIAGRSVVIRATADDFETEEDDGGAGPIVLYGSIVRK